jgi:hypothetical protein
MPTPYLGRTTTQVVVNAAAGVPQDLVAAPGARLKIYVVTIVVVLDVAGTIKFTEGTGPTDLTGAMTLGDTGGFVTIGDGVNPVLQTNTANAKLSLAPVTGAATGWIRYYVAA